MARVDVFFTNIGTPIHYYGIERSVGPRSTNERTDVLLVQFFLKTTVSLWKGVAPPTNGVADQALFDAILTYQKSVKALGMPTVVDGRIDPVPHSGAAYSPTQLRYQHTIISLNYAYMELRPTHYFNVASDPECPADLRDELDIYWMSKSK